MTNETNTLEKHQTEAPRSARKTFMPRTEIFETPDSIVVLADMPGVDEKSVDITLEQNVLTMTGTVTPVAKPGHTLTYAEYEVGNFQRTFTISDEVDRDKIAATVKNGVLRLVLPKTAPARSRKITVQPA